MSEIRLRGTIFQTPDGRGGIYANQPKSEIDAPWLEAEQVLGFYEGEVKEDIFLWAPYKLVPGATRGGAGVLEQYAAVLDMDCADVGALNAIADRLGDVAYILHTSHSHMHDQRLKSLPSVKGQPQHGPLEIGPFDCFRIVLPYSRPVTVDEHKAIVPALYGQYVPNHPQWDPTERDRGRGFFLPSSRTSTSHHAQFEVKVGRVVDVDAILACVTVEVARVHVASPGTDEMHQKADRIRALLCKADCYIGKDSRYMCPMCRRGSESFTMDVSGDKVLLNCFANCPPEGILASLGLGWPDVFPDPVPVVVPPPEEDSDPEPVSSQDYSVPSKDAECPRPADKDIQTAFGSKRIETYHDHEFIALGKRRHRWIVKSAAGYHVRQPGGDYTKPVEAAELWPTCRDMLGPAYPEVKLYNVSEKGVASPKPHNNLLNQYGTVATRTVFSYIIKQDTLVRDSGGFTFRQRVAKPRHLTPTESLEIARWLELLFGDLYGKGLDWLASAPNLEEGVAALWLLGDASAGAGAGKGLLVNGLTRLWTDSHPSGVSFSKALSQFNAPLQNCPVVVINEQLPVSREIPQPLQSLKGLISGEDTPMVADKNIKATSLEGYPRVVISTNSPDPIIRQATRLTEGDLTALNDRILLVQVGSMARAYLEDLPKGWYKRWIAGDELASHISWLAQTRAVEHGVRLLVDGQGMKQRLLVDSPDQSAVLNAILSAVVTSRLPTPYKGPAVIIRDGDVLINRGALSECWKVLARDVPFPGDYGAALGMLTTNENARHVLSGAKLRYLTVRLELLRARARTEDCLEELDTALATQTKREEKVMS